MKKRLIFILYFFCILVAYSQNGDSLVGFTGKTGNLIFDTHSAVIPLDYYEYCECTDISTLANIYSFEDIYRAPFSYKTPAKYLLCSIIQLDSVSNWDKDSSFFIIHTKATIYGTFFSPYYLNYWKPNEDVLEYEYLSGSKTVYDALLMQLKIEENKKTETKNINVIITKKEISVVKKAMDDLQTNLFLLRINDFDKDNIVAYQFFVDGEFDISSLYTPVQYHKYLLDRYLNYMRKKKDRCYITIGDADSVEILRVNGILCNDTIFYIDNEYKEIIKNTKGLEYGRVTLYNENGVVLRQLPIIGPHEQDLSVILGPGIYCSPDGRLYCNEGFFVFPKAEVNNDEKINAQ